jgi:hypothetical protein
MEDRKLPGLMRATNNEEMRLALATALNRGLRNGRAFTRTRHQVLKHTPGKRCVIEYRLEPDGSRVIGKLYRQNRGEKIFANLRSLWHASQAHANGGTVFGMPQPLAYVPDIGMVLQSAVPGRPLSDFAGRDDLPAAIGQAAKNLAALHGLAVATGEKRVMQAHIEKYCHPGPQALMEAVPDAAPLVERILGALASDESLASAPLGPVHGDLGPAQIFIDGGRAFFIDFDGFCLSHPALDLANFLVALKVHFAPRRHELAGIFLETYRESRPPEMLAGLGLYQAFIHLRRAMICFRRQAAADWRRQVRQLLEAANALLEVN